MKSYPLIALLFIVIFFGDTLKAQVCKPIYKKSYGGIGHDETRTIIVTADKGSMVAGRTTSGTVGDYDGVLLKLAEDGAIQWSRRYGGNNDDVFFKVKQTADGGYISIGTTKSFGNPNGEAWIVRTDPTGTLVWARHYGKPGIYVKGKEIIQLSDGSFLFIANEADSTDQSNGIICKIDAAGVILWTRTFDHGSDDGFNSIAVSGNDIFVAGYTTVDRRDGILMKLSLTDGSIFLVQKFLRRANEHDELIDLQTTLDGISFGSRSYFLSPPSSYITNLVLFKMKFDGNIYFRRRADVSFNQYRQEHFQLRQTHDSGFIYIACDSTLPGFPVAVRMGPTGMNEWGKNLRTFENAKVFGLDIIDSSGYLFGGHMNSFQTGNKNKITVFRTDINGKVNDCTPGFLGSFVDTTNYSISSFTWNNISTAILPIHDIITPVSADPGFTVNNICSGQFCVGAPPIADTCNSTFFIRYRSPQNIRAWDVQSTVDGGYLMVGFFGAVAQTEPLLAKLKNNGDILWSRTLNAYMHTALFKKILPSTDGHALILGVDNYTVNHGSADSSILMKVNSNTGEVIWSRYCRGDIYNIAQTDDGGYVFCLNENYGFPPIYTYLVRIDASGNIIWQRKMVHSSSGIPVYRGIFYDQSGIYLAADYYNENPSSSILLERWNAVTGARIWEKRFLLSGQVLNFEGLGKVADTLVVGLNFYTSTFPPQGNFAIFKTDINGNSVGGFKFSVNDVSLFPGQMYSYYNEHRVGRFTQTSNDNFVYAEQSVLNGDTVLQLKKFSGSGEVLWSRKYSNLKKEFVVSVKEIDNRLFILGRHHGGIVDNTIVNSGFIMKTDSVGRVTEGGTGDCFTEETSAATVPLPAFSTGFVTGENPQPSTEIIFHDYQPYRRNVNIWAELSCNVVSTCYDVQISGPTGICNTSDTLVYSALRNPGCLSPITWMIDTSRVKIVSTTDTSIRVYFAGSGSTSILARLTSGCSVTLDTMDVSVFINADLLNLGPDFNTCRGEPSILNATPGFKTYTWQDGSSSLSHVASVPGIYYVDVEDSCGRTKRDSVIVSWYPATTFTAGPDRSKCNTDTIQLIATAGLTDYQWSPVYGIVSSSQSNSVIVNPILDTTYYVTAQDSNGCVVYDTIKVMVNHSPPIELGPDVGFCAGDSALLDAGTGFSGYSWNNGSSSPSIIVYSAGPYNVIGTAGNGCRSMDTVIVTVSSPSSNFLPEEAFLCVGDSVQLTPAGIYNSYLWSTGATSDIIIVGQPGTYWLEVGDDNGCFARESIVAKEKQCMQGVYFPTAFTPNNDGRNDKYKPLVYERLNQYSFSIFNRWGELVFQTADLTKGWDGTFRGVIQDANVYIWTCRYQVETKTVVEEKGTFVLIR